MYFNNIFQDYNSIWLYLILLIQDIEYYEYDKKPIDVKFCNTILNGNKLDEQYIDIEDVKIEENKEGRKVVTLIADRNFNYEVTPIKIEK